MRPGARRQPQLPHRPRRRHRRRRPWRQHGAGLCGGGREARRDAGRRRHGRRLPADGHGDAVDGRRGIGPALRHVVRADGQGLRVERGAGPARLGGRGGRGGGGGGLPRPCRGRGQDDGRCPAPGPGRPPGCRRGRGGSRLGPRGRSGGGRGGHAGHDAAGGEEGPGQLPRRAQRRAPGPGGHLRLPAAEGGSRRLGLAVASYVGALDQGTTSSRFIVFDREGRVVAVQQRPHEQIYPSPGWVEHDPIEIWRRCREVIAGALEQAGLTASDLAAVGVANQRETIVVWDRDTGAPLCNAIVWQDTRTRAICEELIAGDEAGIDRFRELTGLPIATYFSGPKLQWVLDELDLSMHGARGEVLFGTIDTWLIWNLTGGPDGRVHVTDVTNASRTMLMDLSWLRWDPAMLRLFSIPAAMLPAIRSSSQGYGRATGVLSGVPVAAALGDQQAALFGQCCFGEGDTKNTYGTGCFLLANTGERRVASSSGLITTAGYRIGDAPAVYCLEGSAAIAGAVVQWLRGHLCIHGNFDE